MANASVDTIKAYLSQLDGTTADDAILADILDRATAYVETRIGYSFATPASGPRTIYGDGTPYLTLPENGTTVTLVTAPTGYTVPAYVYVDGVLVVKDSVSGVLASTYRYGLSSVYYDFGYSGVWQRNVPYVVTATYGYGAVPADIVEATLQLAVRMWRFRESGGSEVIGTDAGVIEVRAGESPFVKKILDSYKLSSGIGVY